MSCVTFLWNRTSIQKVDMAINQFIQAVVFKLFVAAMFTVVMIISLIHLSQDLHKYLSLFENGESLQFATFSLIFLFCSLCLFLMFRKSNKKQLQENLKSHLDSPFDSMFAFDLKTLKINFIEGFIDGLTKHTTKEKKIC